MTEFDHGSGSDARGKTSLTCECRIVVRLTKKPLMSRNGPELDELDREIVRVLQDDATVSAWGLAGLCHSSEATIRRRIARLRERDVMRIVAVVDPFKQGFSVVAIINMKIDQRKIREIKTALTKMREVRFVGVTVGGYDMVAEA